MMHRSVVANANPVVVEPDPAVEFDGGHVALDTTGFRFDRTGNLRFVIGLMAAEAVLDVILRVHLMNRLVRIVTRGATQLAVGTEITTAPQQSDRLEPDQQIRIVADIFLADTPRQTMTIATELHFRLGIPVVATDRERWRFGTGSSQSNVLAARAMTLFAIDAGNQFRNGFPDDGAAGCVAVNTSLKWQSLQGITEELERFVWLHFGMPRCQSDTASRITADTMFDAEGLAIQSGSERQDGLCVVPRPEHVLQRKRRRTEVGRICRKQLPLFV